MSGAPARAVERRYAAVAAAIVGVAMLVRLLAAARLPLSGDEAYYWEWSRRPAFGYFDHPPMVAWLIAFFSWGANSTLPIRVPFLLCGAGAAGFMFAFVRRATGDTGAAAVSTTILALAPFATIAFTLASPDGPYLFFWSAALYFALRAFENGSKGMWALFGLTLGCAFLSRLLGVALIGGVVLAGAVKQAQRSLQPRPCNSANVFVAALTFCATVSPFVAWNIGAHWSPLRFAVFGRHTDVASAGGVLNLVGLYAAALSPGVLLLAAVWLPRLFKTSLFQARPAATGAVVSLCTALPLLGLCLLLALHERVEFYWADGAFISLIAGFGICLAAFGRRRVALLTAFIPLGALAGVLFVLILAPLQSYNLLRTASHINLRHNGPFEVWSFQPLAADAASEGRRQHAWVVTDGYGLSSVLDFYGGLRPVVIGYSREGSEARKWFDPASAPRTLIFVDKEPLATRQDFARRFREACGRVEDLGARSYLVAGIPIRSFYFTRCAALTPENFRILLWERDSPLAVSGP